MPSGSEKKRSKALITVKKAESLVGIKGDDRAQLFAKVCLGKDGSSLRDIQDTPQVQKEGDVFVWDHPCPPEELEVGDTLQIKVTEKRKWPSRDNLIGVATITITQEMVDCKKLYSLCEEMSKVGSTPSNTGIIHFSFKFEPLDGEAPVSASIGPVIPSMTQETASRNDALPNTLASQNNLPQTNSLGSQSTFTQSTAGRMDNVTSNLAVEHSTAQARVGRMDIVTKTYWERELQTRRQPILCTSGVVAYLRSCCSCNCLSRPNDATANSENKEQVALVDNDLGKENGPRPSGLACRSAPAIKSFP